MQTRIAQRGEKYSKRGVSLLSPHRRWRGSREEGDAWEGTAEEHSFGMRGDSKSSKQKTVGKKKNGERKRGDAS